MTLRKILALTCLLLPMMASAHQFETGQHISSKPVSECRRSKPVSECRRLASPIVASWCLIKISLATKPGTARS